MNREELKALLLQTLEQFAKDKEALANATEDTELREDLKIKSARLVDVVLDLEEKLDVEVEPDDMDEMWTIGEALDVLERYVNK
jgi:acyl carrier protein